MANLKEALQKARGERTNDHSTDTAFLVAEPFIALITGIMIKAWFDMMKAPVSFPVPGTALPPNYTAVVGLLALVFAAMYGLLVYRRVKKPKPTDAVDYALAIQEKDSLSCEVDRHKELGEYIDKSIRALNEHTCGVSGTSRGAELCNSPLSVGIQQVLDDVIQNTKSILSCTKSKFTVLVRIENAPRKTSEGCCIVHHPESMHFRDDFKINNIIESAINGATSGTPLLIRQQAEQSESDSAIRVNVYDFNGTNLKMITAPIPAVCEGENIGMFYIVAEQSIPVPPDVENTLKIFGRIAANWVSKYNDCMVSDIIHGIERLRIDGQLPAEFTFTENDIYNDNVHLPSGVHMPGHYIPPELRRPANN